MSANPIEALIPINIEAAEQQNIVEAREAFAHALKALGISKYRYILSQYLSVKKSLKNTISDCPTSISSDDFTFRAEKLVAMERAFLDGKIDDAMMLARLVQLRGVKEAAFYGGCIDYFEPLELMPHAKKSKDVLKLLPEMREHLSRGFARTDFEGLGTEQLKEKIYQAGSAHNYLDEEAYEGGLNVVEYAFLKEASELAAFWKDAETASELTDEQLIILYVVNQLLDDNKRLKQTVA